MQFGSLVFLLVVATVVSAGVSSTRTKSTTTSTTTLTTRRSSRTTRRTSVTTTTNIARYTGPWYFFTFGALSPENITQQTTTSFTNALRQFGRGGSVRGVETFQIGKDYYVTVAQAQDVPQSFIDSVQPNFLVGGLVVGLSLGNPEIYNGPFYVIYQGSGVTLQALAYYYVSNEGNIAKFSELNFKSLGNDRYQLQANIQDYPKAALQIIFDQVNSNPTPNGQFGAIKAGFGTNQ